MFLAGCASFAPNSHLIGQDRVAVINHMGHPSRERTIPTGSRMEYPRGPFGKSTFFVFLDSSGKVTGWEDVLKTENFHKIKPGMTGDEVELMIGQSKSTWGVAMGNRRVWNYPFSNAICQIFQVVVTPEGKVDSAGYGIAPECDSRR